MLLRLDREVGGEGGVSGFAEIEVIFYLKFPGIMFIYVDPGYDHEFLFF